MSSRASPALQVVKLKAFSKFDSTVDALTSTAALVDSKLPKGGRLSKSMRAFDFFTGHVPHPWGAKCDVDFSVFHSLLDTWSFTLSFRADLKKFLKKNADGNTLGVADSKLGNVIKEKLGIPCIFRCALAFA